MKYYITLCGVKIAVYDRLQDAIESLKNFQALNKNYHLKAGC